MILLVIVPFVLVGCNATNTEMTATTDVTTTQVKIQSLKDITPAETNTLIQANANNPDFIIIDVRTSAEYGDGHLENAVLVDYKSESFREEINKLDHSKKYLVYCRTGVRSAGARDIMKDLDFLDISNMSGGITEWIAQDLQVVK
jgi:rhodanese-related sulfurtransferase